MLRNTKAAIRARKAKERARAIMQEIRDKPLSATLSRGDGSILRKRNQAQQSF